MVSAKMVLVKLRQKYKKWKNKRIQMESGTICTIPWVHLNIIPRGKVYHCCMTSDHYEYAGDLTHQTIEEVWNGEYMKDIRKQMINGQEPKACSKCFDTERSSGTSTRLNHNKYFKDKLKEIPQITREDGHVDFVDLRYWDFRFSNLCNFKCRTCGPEFSSMWLAENKKEFPGTIEEDRKVFNIENVDQSTNVDFLKKYINNVDKIYFAGGEPLLMDEHWQILDMLDQAGRHDVILTYNTNLSKLTYQNKNAIDYWKKWGRKVWLWPSIDEIDERAELIRSGTNWKVVEENLKTVSELEIHVRPSITVSCMNVHRIPEIINRLLELKIIKKEIENWQNFSINVVEFGAHFHVSVLKDETRAAIKKKLEDFIVEYNNKYQVDIRPAFLHLFWHLDKPHNPENAKGFKEFTARMDNFRKEDTLKVIPELKELFD